MSSKKNDQSSSASEQAEERRQIRLAKKTSERTSQSCF